MHSNDHTSFSDGANTVCATCTLRYVRVDEEMLRESVILRIRGASRADLLTPAMYSRLVDALSTLGPFNRHDVHVFSVQEESAVDNSGGGPLLNVSFSIRQPQSTQFVRLVKRRERGVASSSRQTTSAAYLSAVAIAIHSTVSQQ